jgi:hypothetical protein
MGKLTKTAVVVAIILALGGLATSPGFASVAGDIKSGLPMSQVISNGLAAGMPLAEIMDQALASGADVCSLEKAAIGLNIDLPQVFKTLSDVCSANPSLAPTCTPCSLMQCAAGAGVDPVTAANGMMAAGGNLDQVRDCLAGLGYPDAATYAYSPPGPPSGIGPTFPGGGGGGPGGGPPPPPASPST